MKKNNTAQKTALKATEISNALREGTEKTLRNLIREAIEDMVDSETEEVEDGKTIDDDSVEVQDVETNKDSEETPENEPSTEDGESKEASDSADAENGDADDEWGGLDDFKVGDNEYDFTGADGDTALKVYNKLGDSDQISVKKEDDGTYTVTDGESGAELVIELEPEDSEVNADADIETSDADELNVDLAADADVEPEEGEPSVEDDAEIEIDLDGDTDDENLDENLGYTDNYQNKDVIDGLNVNEPADKKATYSMDGGVPDNAKKPWAGSHKEKDYTETHTDLAESCKEGKVCDKCGKTPCECDKKEIDENQTTSKAQRRKEVKTAAPNSGETDKPEVSKEVSVAGQLSEAKARQIIEAAKAIQAENKQIKATAKELRQGLLESAVVNKKLGYILNLFVNESTTKEEKIAIIKSFEGAKTLKESRMLFETHKNRLEESAKKSTASILNEQISAESSKTINETPIFNQQTNRSLQLMERMEKLPSYNKRTNSTFSVNPNDKLNESISLMQRMEKL